MLAWRRIVNFGFGHGQRQTVAQSTRQQARKTLEIAQTIEAVGRPSADADEQEKQARQRWFHRLEQRQKVIDVESRLEQYRLTGNELYRLR